MREMIEEETKYIFKGHLNNGDPVILIRMVDHSDNEKEYLYYMDIGDDWEYGIHFWDIDLEDVEDMIKTLEKMRLALMDDLGVSDPPSCHCGGCLRGCL